MRRVAGTIVLILLMWCFGLALIVQAEHSRQDDWTEYIEHRNRPLCHLSNMFCDQTFRLIALQR